MKLIFSVDFGERQQILSLLAEFKLLETDRTDFAGKVHCGPAWTLTFLVSLQSEREPPQRALNMPSSSRRVARQLGLLGFAWVAASTPS